MVPPLTLCAYMKKGPNLRWSLIQCSGGDEGDRTPDLLTASQALSQLSYAPVRRSTIRELGRRCKDNFRKTFAGPGAHVRVRGPSQGRGARDARGGSGPRTDRAPADLASGTRLSPCNRVFRAPPVPLSGLIAKRPSPCASEPCPFTTMNQECPITLAFWRKRRASYLRFCKWRTRGARASPIRRSKPAWF